MSPSPPTVSARRIVVVGSSCSGKSTFARALAGRLHSPHIELDALNWMADWQARPPDELRTLVAEAVAQPAWVVDGNYWSLSDLVWPRATTMIWLNYPRRVVFGRAVRRTVRRVFRREVLYGGNRERFRQAFLSRDSILLWVVRIYGRRLRRYRRLFDEGEYPEVEKIELRHPRSGAAYLQAVGQAS